MRGRSIPWGFFVLILLCMASATWAGDNDFPGWEVVSTTDWDKGNVPEEGEYKAFILFEHVVEDDRKMESDRIYRTLYRRIRILANEGREWSNVEVPIFSDKQKVEEILGRTILPDGTIIPLDESNIMKKEVFKTKKKKYTQYSFTLPGVTDDCIIEYYFRIKSPELIGKWISQYDIPMQKGTFTWVFYKFEGSGALVQSLIRKFGTPNYLWFNTVENPAVEYLPNLTETEKLYFEIHDVQPFEEEPYTLPSDYLHTHLLCYYSSSESSAAYWGDRSSSIDAHLAEFTAKDKKLKKIVQAFGPLNTPREKIDSAYTWIQKNIYNVTYRELHDSKKPDKIIDPKENEDIDDVMKHGYGTTGDINNVFYHMLRLMNIDAKKTYYVDRDEDVFVSKAKFWQFTDNMVAVPTENEAFEFYSPGMLFLTEDLQPRNSEGGTAFVIGSENSFVTVPFSQATMSTTVSKYDFTISDDLEVTGNMMTQKTGHDAREIRKEIFDKDSSACEIYLKEFIGDFLPGCDVRDAKAEYIEEIEYPLVLSCNVKSIDLEDLGGKVFFKPFGHIAQFEDPFTSETRENPILLDYAHRRQDIASYSLPDSYTIEALPNDTTFANDVGVCRVSFSQEGDSLVAKRDFELTFPYWHADQYPIVKDLYGSVRQFDNLIVILSKATKTGAGE